MRTIVVFHASSALWYCELSDLAAKPARGDYFVYRGTRYQVQSTTEPLGALSADGTRKRSGDEKLLEILGTLFSEEEALKLFAALVNVGSNDGMTRTPGGLVTISSGFGGDFDHLVFVSLKAEKSSTFSIGELVKKASALLASQVPSGEQPATPELEPIRVTDESVGAPTNTPNHTEQPARGGSR